MVEFYEHECKTCQIHLPSSNRPPLTELSSFTRHSGGLEGSVWSVFKDKWSPVQYHNWEMQFDSFSQSGTNKMSGSSASLMVCSLKWPGWESAIFLILHGNIPETPALQFTSVVRQWSNYGRHFWTNGKTICPNWCRASTLSLKNSFHHRISWLTVGRLPHTHSESSKKYLKYKLDELWGQGKYSV